jgi:hypothetical protein
VRDKFCLQIFKDKKLSLPILENCPKKAPVRTSGNRDILADFSELEAP